jgi:aminoglycoside phosphotransferase family enzyme
VRECHGDLHLGNLVLIDKRMTLFDCIEFSEDLRWIDVASEIAFTYIDLLDQRQPGLAGWLLNEWLPAAVTTTQCTVLRFYAVYRALVRAKVAAIRASRQMPISVRRRATSRLPSASCHRRRRI